MIKVATFNTLPTKKDTFWQVVLFPTISILNSIDRSDSYIAVNCEWLFWSATFLIFKNDNQGSISQSED